MKHVLIGVKRDESPGHSSREGLVNQIYILVNHFIVYRKGRRQTFEWPKQEMIIRLFGTTEVGKLAAY